MFARIKNGFNRMVWKYLPDCKDITALVSRSMEKDLSFRERVVLKTHLYTCLACRNYLTQLEFMNEVFEKQEEKREQGEFAPRLSNEAAERLKNALNSSKLLFLCVLAYCY
jgi:predicted anti-sigma-YlaC factor YlaD